MRLELSGVTLRAGRATILGEVSFEAEEGRITALLGPTGSGKTSILRVADLLVRPSSGTVLLDGVDRTACGPGEATRLRRRMSLVMQKPFMLSGSVARNVLFGLRARGGRPGRETVLRALGPVGLQDFADRDAGTLSGGEAQKVALARALVTGPEILMLDEPMSSVDQEQRPALRSLIRRIHRDSGQTVLLATHDLADALALADRAVILSGGRVVQQGTMEEVAANPVNRFAAMFTGMRNVYRCSASGSRAVLGGLEIVLPRAAEGTVTFSVPPDSVIVSSVRPETSMRNCLPGVVASVQAGLDAATVNVSVSGLTIASTVTGESAERLALLPGTGVWVSFKASSIRIFD